MIYLIGGSPRCGKTILANKLSSKLKISHLSTDAFYPMVLSMIPKSERKKRFPQTNMPTPEGKFRFDVYPHQKTLKAQIVEAKTMWTPIKAFVSSLINREQDFIIEGIHLFPKLVNEFKGTKYWKQIRLIYLIKTDLDKIQSRFSKSTDVFDWMYPAIKNDEVRLRAAAKYVKSKSDYVEKEAKKYRLKIFHTDTFFNKTLKEAQDYLIRD